jgi:hypothetical protein
MKKVTKQKTIALRLNEADYQILVKLRTQSNITTSEMIRNSIQFYSATYSKPTAK